MQGEWKYVNCKNMDVCRTRAAAQTPANGKVHNSDTSLFGTSLYGFSMEFIHFAI